MTGQSIFEAVNRAALARLPDVLKRILPGGRVIGAQFRAGSLGGECGDSLKVALTGDRRGAWCDFAAGCKGGDVVSLAAAVWRVRQIDAARRLAAMLNVTEAQRHGRR